jgi:hypothetical protein
MVKLLWIGEQTLVRQIGGWVNLTVEAPGNQANGEISALGK